jgi:predicted metal-binding transcription factor (methanogenesis marker protein 9)
MQCRHINPQYGQCPEDAMEQRDYCPIHAHLAKDHDQKQQYQLLKHKYRERTSQLAGHNKMKGLQWEIAIAEMMLENRINSITSQADEISAGGFIKEQLALIEKLKTASQKLEIASGNLLSKETLVTVAGETVKVLLEELKDIPDFEGIVDRISNRMFTIIDNAQNTEQ